MDVCLAGRLDGFEAVREIRLIDPVTPIMIASAVDDPTWLSRARSAGANGLLCKPITMSVVTKMLADIELHNTSAMILNDRKMSDPCPFDMEFFALSQTTTSTDRLVPLLLDAIRDNDVDVVRCLLNETPSLVAWSDPLSGNYALHFAARVGNLNILQLLIESFGADVNNCSQKGCNALHVAAWRGFVECVKVLLSHGCNTKQIVRVAVVFVFYFSDLLFRVRLDSVRLIWHRPKFVRSLLTLVSLKNQRSASQAPP
jgi:CheY-like chemotaxis protein